MGLYVDMICVCVCVCVLCNQERGRVLYTGYSPSLLCTLGRARGKVHVSESIDACTQITYRLLTEVVEKLDDGEDLL